MKYSLNRELPGSQDSLQYGDDLCLDAPVAALENPYEFGQHDRRDEASARLAAFFFDDVSSFRGLPTIVLRDVTNEDVGIETKHRLARRRLIAAFIALIETGDTGLRIIPLSERTSSVAGLSANSPGTTLIMATVCRRSDELAEREGFEPPLGCPKPDFESAGNPHRINRNAAETSAKMIYRGLCLSILWHAEQRNCGRTSKSLR